MIDLGAQQARKLQFQFFVLWGLKKNKKNEKK